MKKKIITWLIIITIYMLSSFYCKHWLSIAYSDNGIFRMTKPSTSDLVVIFTPCINTVGAIIFIFYNPEISHNELYQGDELAKKLLK